MSYENYTVTTVEKYDSIMNAKVDALLRETGIRRDRNLDETVALVDDGMNVIATGSYFKNTLRCMAVSPRHQGESLMNTVVSVLFQRQAEQGNFHVFLYTKDSTASFFGNLGFYPIARIPDKIVFMENRRNGFDSFIAHLKEETAAQTSVALEGGKSAAIVMNANPFTLGHRYLIERALEENAVLHLFIVSEDVGLIPAAVRRRLIFEGLDDLRDRIIFHDSGSYIISAATFPAYFQRDEKEVIITQAGIDIAVFTRIARALNISSRYVGEEKSSVVTSLYNKIMLEKLPSADIEVRVIPRLQIDGEVVSASTVRQAIHDGDGEKLRNFLPGSGYAFFSGPEGFDVVKKIQSAVSVRHY